VRIRAIVSRMTAAASGSGAPVTASAGADPRQHARDRPDGDGPPWTGTHVLVVPGLGLLAYLRPLVRSLERRFPRFCAPGCGC
jgi:hypothetical protein